MGMRCLGVSKGSVAGEKKHKTGQEGHISTAGWPLGLFFVGYINELFLSWLCVSGFPKARAGSAHGPCGSHAPLGIPRAISGLGLAPFWQLLFWPAGGYLRPRAKTMVFHAQGGTRGVLVQKVAVLGPPTSTLAGPIGDLVGHNIFRDIFQKVH